MVHGQTFSYKYEQTVLQQQDSPEAIAPGQRHSAYLVCTDSMGSMGSVYTTFCAGVFSLPCMVCTLEALQKGFPRSTSEHKCCKFLCNVAANELRMNSVWDKI